MFSYPELLFILIVMALPMPIAFHYAHSGLGFLLNYVIGMVAGLVVWLAIIFLIVWPKFK
jgi:hypothetical protein